MYFKSMFNDFNILKIQSFVAYLVEMNLAWNETGTGRLTLYYDFVEELGRLACVKCLFFSLGAGSLLACEYSRLSFAPATTTTISISCRNVNRNVKDTHYRF